MVLCIRAKLDMIYIGKRNAEFSDRHIEYTFTKNQFDTLSSAIVSLSSINMSEKDGRKISITTYYDRFRLRNKRPNLPLTDQKTSWILQK